MGRTHFTIVTPGAPTELYCEHHRSIFFSRRRLNFFYFWMQLLIRSNGGHLE